MKEKYPQFLFTLHKTLPSPWEPSRLPCSARSARSRWRWVDWARTAPRPPSATAGAAAWCRIQGLGGAAGRPRSHGRPCPAPGVGSGDDSRLAEIKGNQYRNTKRTKECVLQSPNFTLQTEREQDPPLALRRNRREMMVRTVARRMERGAARGRRPGLAHHHHQSAHTPIVRPHTCRGGRRQS